MSEKEMLELILQTVNGVGEDVSELKEGFSKLDEKVGRLEESVVKLDERVGRLEERVVKLDERVGDLDERVVRLDERVSILDEKAVKLTGQLAGVEWCTKEIQLSLENETNRNILAVADGHLALERKLGQAVVLESEKEMLEIRMNVVESEIAKIKAKYESA